MNHKGFIFKFILYNFGKIYDFFLPRKTKCQRYPKIGMRFELTLETENFSFCDSFQPYRFNIQAGVKPTTYPISK